MEECSPGGSPEEPNGAAFASEDMPSIGSPSLEIPLVAVEPESEVLPAEPTSEQLLEQPTISSEESATEAVQVAEEPTQPPYSRPLCLS